MSRRFIRHGLCLLLLLGAWSPAQSAVLHVLAWPGYAEPEVIHEFEQAHGVEVQVTTIDSDEALWQKVTEENSPFDVFAVNTAELQRYIRAGYVQPIDTEHIPNIRRQLPRFRTPSAIPGLTSQGKVYGVPFTYSAMGLIYDKKQISTPPDSISALWDPHYEGKVLAFNGGTHNFTLAAQKLGITTPFDLKPAQWPEIVDALIALRRNVLYFYSQPEESVQMFTRHHAALMLANYGMQQVHLLKAAGVDVGYSLPREGALAWLDTWAIPRKAAHPDLALDWINHMLGKTASRLLVSRQGLANTTEHPVTDDDDHRLIWLQPVEDVAKREKLWARIYSGDNSTRVLEP